MDDIRKFNFLRNKIDTHLFYRFTGSLFLFFIFTTSFASSKIDTIYFQGGDRITGEVKSLDNNLLKLSTDDSGTISIEWDRIDSVFIKNPMRITMMDGVVRHGQIKPSGMAGECTILVDYGETEKVKLWNIVELVPLEKRFIDRLSGTVSSGFSFVKASNVTKLDFAGTVEYRGEKLIFQADYDVILTKESTEITQRQSGGASLHRVLPKNWSIQGRLLAESNSYFELDLRTTVALGPNYFLIRNNKQRLSAGVGLLANKEFSGELTQNNFESLVQLSYKLFLFDSPEVSIDFQGNLIPGLSEFGRFRNETDININWEVFNDFYLKWTFYNSFDNQPLSGIDVHRDWGTSLGLEFKF